MHLTLECGEPVKVMPMGFWIVNGSEGLRIQLGDMER